jgi:hypothetical protein
MMDEQMVRELVRQAVARRLGEPAAATVHVPLALMDHSSHRRWVLPESEGPCLIEPNVQCMHCGFCQSHGH